MPKNNRRKQKRGRGRKGNPHEFYRPVFREFAAPQSSVVTLNCQFAVASPVVATNGEIIPIAWKFFNDAAPYAKIYKYFEIVGCRVKFSLATTVAATDSFYDGAVAYYPINYTKDNALTIVPVDESSILEMPGSICVQAGAKNFGRWFDPGIKEQFATNSAFNTTTSFAAGYIITYFEDLGISEQIGTAFIQVNVRFSQRAYNGTVPTLDSDSFFNVNPKPPQVLEPENSSVEILVDKSTLPAGTECRDKKPCNRRLK